MTPTEAEIKEALIHAARQCMEVATDGPFMIAISQEMICGLAYADGWRTWAAKKPQHTEKT